MGYYFTFEPEAVPRVISCASPKTHTPGSPVKERGYHLTTSDDARTQRSATKYPRVNRKPHGGPKTNWVLSTKYTDSVTGLLYYGHRYYQPEGGRWASRDPADEVEGSNIYHFTYNAPVMFIDKDGRCVPVLLYETFPIWGPYVFVAVTYVGMTIVKTWERTGTSIRVWQNSEDICGTCRPTSVDAIPITTTQTKTITLTLPPLGCRECQPYAKGTRGFEGPSSGTHTHFPAGSPHYHAFRVNQVPYPICTCFWNRDTPDAINPPVPANCPVVPEGSTLPPLYY